MPKIVEEDKRVTAAAILLIHTKGVLTTKKAMLAEEFSKEEAENGALQKRVQRAKVKICQQNNIPYKNEPPPILFCGIPLPIKQVDVPVPVLPGHLIDSNSSISVLSDPFDSCAGKLKPKKKIRIRKPPQQQKPTNNNIKVTEEQKIQAHKEATTLYAMEKCKENGLSAAKVCEIINIKYGTNIRDRSIQRYVQKGLIGANPLKKGPPKGYGRKVTEEQKIQAHKEATIMYAKEKDKEKGLSAKKVCDIINLKYGTSINARNIQRYVLNGFVGTAPLKRGPSYGGGGGSSSSAV